MRYEVTGIPDWHDTEKALYDAGAATLSEITAVLHTRGLKQARLKVCLEGEKTVVLIDCTERKELF